MTETISYSSKPPLPNDYKKDNFEISQKVLSLSNKNIIKDGVGNKIGFSQQKMLKLKDEMTVYKDESKSEAVFKIKQNNIMDINANFEVIDSLYDQTVGYLEQQSFKSLTRNHWTLIDVNKNDIGLIRGKGSAKSRLKQSISGKSKYEIMMNGEIVGSLNEKMSWTAYTFKIDIDGDPEYKLDRRLPIAVALCIGALRSNR